MYPKTWLSEHLLCFDRYFTQLLLPELMLKLLMTDHTPGLTVLKAEVNSEGCDLVLSCGPALQCIQVKTLGRRASPVNYAIKASSADLLEGCELCLCYDNESFKRTHDHFFGRCTGGASGNSYPLISGPNA
ncbi:MAG: hypothetical protein JSS71_10430 [Armatimonadetes bacterium]|nr:hypothetical protein [Armatimonadota bacterium]MBX3107837.1 hypothetical protein [Fimbriimonadaceae bacterium]